MPPLNVLKDISKPQTLEMEEECLRENFSQQELVRQNSVSVGGASTRTTRRQMITVGILCYVNLINYMDRYTVAGLLYDVGKSFSLSESQEGLLQTVFIVAYMIFAPIYGYLGDRFNRKYLMAFGVFVWSLTTLLGSFMPNYSTFLVMRGLVGIGEASYSTIAPTIISDIFVSNTRSKMLALFYFAIPVGSGLGYIIGAEVSRAAKSILPPEADMDAWRWGLRVTPIMGFAAVLLLLFVLQDPPRGECEGAEHLKATSFCKDLKGLFTNKSYILTTIAFTCVTYVAGALAWWGPKFVQLGVDVQNGNSNVPKDSVAFVFGVVAMIAGLIGVPLGSFSGQKLRMRFPAADPIVCGCGLVISMPLLIGGIFLASINTIGAFVVVLLGEIFLNLNWAVVSDIVLYIVLPTRRSSAEAFQILFSHAFGDAGSPYIVGLVAESLKPLLSSATGVDPPNANYVEFKSLQYSLAITMVMELIAGLFFFLTAIYIVKDKDKVDRTIAGDFIEESSSTGGDSVLASSQPHHRFADETDIEQRHHLIT